MSETRSYDDQRQRSRLFNLWLTAQQYEHLAALAKNRGSTMSATVRAGISLLDQEATKEMETARV